MYSGARQIASTSSSKPSTSEVARYNLKPSEIGGSSKHPYRLNFYDKPPVEEITLEDFETWAIDRLRGELILKF